VRWGFVSRQIQIIPAPQHAVGSSFPYVAKSSSISRGGRKPLPAAHGIILAKCCENFAGGAPTAGQGAVDGAIVSGEIRGLSSKE